MSRLIPASETEEWGTPHDLWKFLNGLFRFTIDLAASPENALLPRYYTKEQDALVKDWVGERAFCNPPYDWRSLERFTREAWTTWSYNGCPGFGVFLLPCKTDQAWFHEFVNEQDGVYIRFLRGRQKYIRPGKTAGAGFPSMLVGFGVEV